MEMDCGEETDLQGPFCQKERAHGELQAKPQGSRCATRTQLGGHVELMNIYSLFLSISVLQLAHWNWKSVHSLFIGSPTVEPAASQYISQAKLPFSSASYGKEPALVDLDCLS